MPIAMAASPSYVSINRNIIVIIVFVICLSLTRSSSVTLPLRPHLSKPPNSDPFKLAASASLTRAHHLKHGDKSSTSTLSTPLYPKSYGAYSIDLSFGTPPQSIPMVFDTGSSLPWVPCTTHYLCSHCAFSNASKIKTFIPKLSSTAKLLACTSPKCTSFFGSHTCPNCPHCPKTCPAYILQYGSGSTAGFLLLDTLRFPQATLPDFLLGCSILSVRQPSGIGGFGRHSHSLPSQLFLKRFSYCLISHTFDDSTRSSQLLLQTTSTGDSKTHNLTYTPFYPNPPSSTNAAFSEYYYVTLRKVLVGPNSVKIPFPYLQPDSHGNGGTIVDSGTTFTYMERPVYDLLSQELVLQMHRYSRAKDIEDVSGLSPCYNVAGVKNVTFPGLTFQFKGGARMKLPLQNYFSFVGGSEVVCFTIVSDEGTKTTTGPAVILGNYQQQNFHIEYDLENERFGFRPQKCTTKY
ncbi:hypothetical protein Fmac_006572 [Flemingia macrophylla]|uniref:Peptidase A1 domain-containing protein n=1 Tax=Flemingia macrophylla TaxID=520843 RepID=A0ABD1NC66_9FABA